MKRTVPISLSIVLLSAAGLGKETRIYEDDHIKCSYETTQGRLDGWYVSHYGNGRKKAEGRFVDNLRTGQWTVWDSTGRMRIQREYTDPFTFKRTFPEAPDEGPIKLLNVPQYQLRYNEDGFIEYFHLKERMVVWATRVWRYITPDENPVLFEDNRLFGLMVEGIRSKEVTAYKDDRFMEEMAAPMDMRSHDVIGFRVKEDVIFDSERLVSEARILGICPVAIDRRTKDTLDVFWVYHPQFRRYLAREMVQWSGTTSTLDDLFFFRRFHGRICRGANAHGGLAPDHQVGDGTGRESERMEIGLIEKEHDIWTSLTE